MLTVNELYKFLGENIPSELSCEWDNDGRMCVPNGQKTVKKALVCLDITDDAIDFAIENKVDCIVSHHPLVFKAIKGVDDESFICKRLIKLIKNDISALSFHTRLDRFNGGVNDVLCEKMGLYNVCDFADVGRMGECEQTSLKSFAQTVKTKLCSDRVVCVDAGETVNKIAVVGGSGKGYIGEAARCGCDTFITGEMSFDNEHEARELGVNLVCAGHYFTENIVCDELKALIQSADKDIEVLKTETNPSFCI